jgi:4'-phosphopantetheinyl transferase
MTIELNPGQMHVWHANIGPQPTSADSLQSILSQTERDRAARLIFDTHRTRYIHAHVCLRLLLGAYLHVTPQAISFISGPFGKPYIAANDVVTPDQRSLEFNISHSADLAVFGFSRAATIGIDTEFVNRRINVEEIAQTVFTRSELASMRALTPSAQFDYFFDLWSRKEAYAKALGMGLQIPFNELEIGRQPMVDGLGIHSFVPAPGYAAAFAVPQPVDAIHYFEFQSTFWNSGIDDYADQINRE